MCCGKSESSGMFSSQNPMKMKEQMSKKMLVLWSLCGLFTIVNSSTIPHHNELANKDDGNSVNCGINNDDSSRKFDGLLTQRQFSSTKERPELNLVLSELINADVKKSIESKRKVDLLLPPPVPTTYRPSLTTDRNSLSALVNDGLVDQSIELDEAGSDNKQTSRIQIKKGSNGVDYEYEYVYYYYDEDEKEDKMENNNNHRRGGTGDKKERLNKSTPTSTIQSSSSVSVSNNNNEGSVPVSRNGKDRVGNYEVYEDTSDKRLPINTRFPPRNGNGTPSYISSDIDETTKKFLVKRPSLELVDSQSFNRDDKGGGKGSKLIENEFRMVLPQSTIATSVGTSITTSTTTKTPPISSISTPTNSIYDSEELSTESIDITTTPPPFMEKLAIDLYAILANENLSVDITTSDSLGMDDDINSEITITTDQDGQTTVIPITKTTSTVTTTSVTTTIVPTTTITTEEATTTTTQSTTTTEATSLTNNRKSPFKSGRNRFHHNKQDSSAEKIKPTTAVISENSPEIKKPNRFSRPSSSFGRGGNNKRTSTQSPTSTEEVKKESVAPVQRGGSPSIGRTRNRFNVNTASTPASQVEDNSSNGTMLPQSNKHHRLSYQSRSHVKPTFPSTNNNEQQQQTTVSETNSTLTSGETTKIDKNNNNSLPRSSRFNLGRPNRLLANRNRGLKPQLPESGANVVDNTNNNNNNKSGNAVGQSSEQEDGVLTAVSGEDSNGVQAPVVETTKSSSIPLNRLKNRSRLQPNPHNVGPTTTVAATVNRSKETTPIRKINPFVSRRKVGSSQTTAEPSSHEEENLATHNETAATKTDDNETATEPIEVSSEQSPPVLGLIGSRRRLQIRKPGTIL